MDEKKKIEEAKKLLADSGNVIKTRDDRGLVLVDKDGNIVDDKTPNVAFDVDMKKNVKLAERQLPVMKCRLDDGSVKYVLPVYGAGLWGPIWGYLAIAADGKTILGANFDHKSETPGLGGEITTEKFKGQFSGKQILENGNIVPIQFDAITGATKTSNGVKEMIDNTLEKYSAYLIKFAKAEK